MNNETKNQRTSDSIEALMLLTIGMSSRSDASLAQKVLDAIEDLQELQESRKADSSEPVAWMLEGGGAPDAVTLDKKYAYIDPLRDVIPLYAMPQPIITDKLLTLVLPEEIEPDDGNTFDYVDGWNECRAAMFERQSVDHVGQASLTRAQTAPELHSSPKSTESLTSCAAMLQAGNDGTTGKPLTINLPDTSSKAFWSGTGKNEVFHPEAYKRQVKDAIERSCVIAGIEVKVK